MSAPAFFSGQMNVAKNADWIAAFQLTDSVNPIDLSGSDFRLMIRKHEEDHEAVVTAQTPDDGIQLDDPVNGMFSIVITRDKLARLFAGNYVSDLIRYRPDGCAERIWDASPVQVIDGTTRAMTDAAPGAVHFTSKAHVD